MGNALEPQPLVKSDRGVVGRIDAADHHVLTERQRQRERASTRARPTPRPRTSCRMHGVLDCVTIAGRRHSPLAERGKAENIAAGSDGDQHRKIRRATRREPCPALVEARGLQRINRRRVGDHLVVDRQDGRKVAPCCASARKSQAWCLRRASARGGLPSHQISLEAKRPFRQSWGRRGINLILRLARVRCNFSVSNKPPCVPAHGTNTGEEKMTKRMLALLSSRATTGISILNASS
jgi:hypothetical protein